jgi:hypothetical protein
MLYEGTCHGGFMDGHRFGSNRHKGFLVVNRDHQGVVIYDRTARGNEFHARSNDSGGTVHPESKEGRWRAALGSNYDVFPYDPERMPPWRP